MLQPITHIQLFDGAMGTMLTGRKETEGVLFENLNVLSPELVQDIHRQYLEAGAEYLTTNTFGANRIKLKDSKFSLEEVIDAAIANARKAAENSSAKVIFDIGPSGKLMEPLGDLTFEAAYDNIKEIVQYTRDKVDGYLIETYADLLEMKAAVLAVKENCTLPLFATMTFEESGRTLTGSTPEIVALTLTSLQVDALGVNCSTGPDRMIEIVEKMRAFTHLPILVQPNKGLPEMCCGQISYSLNNSDFAFWTEKIVAAGATIVGGCCGTTPQTIRSISHLKQTKTKSYKPISDTYICSATRLLKLEKGILCGERLNPTGKKLLQKALLENNFDFLQQEALQQAAAQADFLDVNVGIPNCDEKTLIVEAVKKIQEVCELPLQLDSANPAAIEAAIRIYNGVPMINSVNGNEESMQALFPVIAKYGAVSVALTLDKNGIPETPEGRLEIAKKIIAKAAEYGIGKHLLVFDALVMTISSNQQHGRITLETLAQLKKLGVLTIIGLSNISFGLPQRAYLNRTFLIMALQSGLDIAIMNPNDTDSVRMLKAFNALAGYDDNCATYIAASNATPVEFPVKKQSEQSLYQTIVQGLKGTTETLTNKELEDKTPETIINEILIPALTEVGEKFEKGTLFLPQLINSAETAKAVFAILAKHFKQIDTKKEKIILATVQGDIHDIGKNIVKIVLESHGFQVIDLGKNVAIEKVVEAFGTHQPDAIGLSALMTTTVDAMAKTIAELRKLPNICPIFVGGAVVTEQIAKEIGADLYGADALATVNKLEELWKK